MKVYFLLAELESEQTENVYWEWELEEVNSFLNWF